MLGLTEVEIEGFRSFVDRTKVEFPSSGMVLINGHWKGLQYSSGSGKSTFPMAIAFPIDCCDLPATMLKSWYGGKLYCRARFVDHATGDVYDVIKSPKLKLVENGVEYKSMTKGVEERLREIFRTSPDLMKTLTYRPQREKGRFLNSTDAQNKEFLSSLLGLSAIEQAADDEARVRDKLSSDLNLLGVQVAQLRSSLPALASAAAQISEAEQRYVEAKRRVQALGSKDEQAQLYGRAQQLSAEISRVRGAMTQASIAQHENQSIRTQVMSVQEEIKVILANICPTCRREWDQGQDRIDQLQLRIDQLLAKMKANIAIVDSVAPMQEALPGLQAELQEVNRKVGELQAPAADAASALRSAEALLGQLMRQKDQHAAIEREIAAKEAKGDAMADELEVANHAAEVLSRSGFLSVIFDDVLREIEARANEMIGKLPNIASMSVQMSSSHETKSGTVKKSISCKIFKDGEEVAFKGLSGGQQCGLELFTDLAVSETIRKRSGSPVGWMVLDEAMDGLDVELKKEALQVIRKHVSGTILVIDHSTEIKEMFDKSIQVEYDGRTSRVV